MKNYTYFDAQKVFDYLWENGFIYSDEYYDGTPAEHDMSQGEYAAVDSYFWECFLEHIQNMDLEATLQCLQDVMESGDDVKMFWTGPSEAETLFWNFDSTTMEFYGSMDEMPEWLKEKYIDAEEEIMERKIKAFQEECQDILNRMRWNDEIDDDTYYRMIEDYIDTVDSEDLYHSPEYHVEYWLDAIA